MKIACFLFVFLLVAGCTSVGSGSVFPAELEIPANWLPGLSPRIDSVAGAEKYEADMNRVRLKFDVALMSGRVCLSAVRIDPSRFKMRKTVPAEGTGGELDGEIDVFPGHIQYRRMIDEGKTEYICVIPFRIVVLGRTDFNHDIVARHDQRVRILVSGDRILQVDLVGGSQ